MKKKLNLKEHLNDDTLDLSLNDLQDVPVKEIAAFPKATSLDLSNNKLSTIPKNFPTSLTHLVRLDLSQNRLNELPDNFGCLVHLTHLDLYKNNLKTLPLSCGSLRSLRWLDLKNNPLVPKMAKIVGPCVDIIQCQMAAKNTVAFLKDMQKQVEEEKRRQDELERAQQERIAEQIEKKEPKKKKKKKAKNQVTNKPVTENGTHIIEQEKIEKTETISNHKNNLNKQSSSRRGRQIFGTVLMVLSGLVKLVAMMVMVAMLSLFVVSLVDEATYQKMRTRLETELKSASGRMPRDLLDVWARVSALSGVYAKILAENASALLRAAVDLYVWLTTDEKVQAYVETLTRYWHIVYIKMTEYITTAFNYMSTYVKN